MNDSTLSIVKSAARVLEIFELFDELRRPVAIAEVSVNLGYPHSSAAALLKSLTNLGYLEYDPDDRTYFPSIRISMLGRWVEAESLPVRTVLKLMHELQVATSCTVITAIRSGAHAQYIKVLQGTTTIRYHVKAGTRRLLHRSTLGRTLLAQMEESRARQLIEQSLALDDAPSISVASCLSELKRIRRQGYAVYTGLVEPNGTLIGVPLRLDQRGRGAAIGLAAPKEWIEAHRDRFVDLLVNTVARAEAPTSKTASR
jgi:DNA-binding IclR family transcriptional regulator